MFKLFSFQNWPFSLRVFISLALFGTLGIMFIYVAVQQMVRSGANEPQIQIAEDIARALEKGAPIQSFFPPGVTEISESLAPFLLVYSEEGNALAFSAVLDKNPPTFPKGVFQYVKQHGEDRVTWQPRQDVRIAAVVTHFVGVPSGFVVAGRSLREAERRVERLGAMSFMAWIALLIISGFFSFLFFRRSK